MLSVNNVCKRYKNNIVLDRVNFEVKNREIVGFLGPNGAGKSTTMKIITGFLKSDSGEVSLNGKDITKNLSIRKKIGYLPENPPLYDDMTVFEYLNFICELKKINLESIGKHCSKKSYVENLLDELKTKNYKNKLIKFLSKGYRQRVGLAAALIGKPELLVLDEPTNGLDPEQTALTREILKKAAETCGIILSTHLLSEASSIATKIVIINKGKILAKDSTENLRKNIGSENKLIISVRGFKNDILNTLWKIDGIVRIKIEQKIDKNFFKILIETKNDKDIRKNIQIAIIENDMELTAMEDQANSLESLFLEYVSKDNGTLSSKELYDMDFGHDLPLEDRLENKSNLDQYESFKIKEELEVEDESSEKLDHDRGLKSKSELDRKNENIDLENSKNDGGDDEGNI